MHDHAAVFAADGTVWALLIGAIWVGLLGGFTHCAGMCGPFVLAQTARRMANDRGPMSELRRLGGAALFPYHLGRATIYVGLGALGGWLSAAIVQGEGFKFVMAALLAIGGVMMIRPALAGSRAGSWGGGFYARLIEPVMGSLAGGSGYGLGLALGFLPCGMVYAALAAAAATGSAAGGAVVMAGFAAGTMPGLIAVAFLGELAGRRWRQAMARLAPWLMAANGAVLLYLAARNFL